jgi:hypothetical protein
MVVGSREVEMIGDRSEWPQLAIRPVVGFGLIYHAGPMLWTRAGHENFVHMLKEQSLLLLQEHWHS